MVSDLSAAMPIDYSKWDKLELSDDSDVEVHPNVDKRSFIRWKQRDIHEKREVNRMRSEQLELNIETNQDLIKRVRKLIAAAESGTNVGADVEAAVKLAAEGETKDKPSRAKSAEQPKYDDMVESLLVQVTQDSPDRAGLLAQLRHHEKMISDSIDAETKELDELREERARHIVSEDLHDGWNSTIVYKSDDKKPEAAAPTKAATATTTEVEVLNPGAGKPAPPKKNEDGLEELLPATKEFGAIAKGDLSAAYRFMSMHPEILTEGQKDALMMSAFDRQLAGDGRGAETVVFNALLIQYVVLLNGNSQAFFSKVVQANHPARTAFEEDVSRTYDHIKHRCEVLQQEGGVTGGEEEEQEQIQLHAVDPNTEIVVAVPEEGSEGRAVYDGLPEPVRQAIETRKLDEINKVLAEMSIEDAEDLVGKLGEAGVLLVEEKIYDAAEWEEKKHELAE